MPDVSFTPRDLEVIHFAMRKAPIPYDDAAPIIAKIEMLFASPQPASSEPPPPDPAPDNG